MAQRAGELCHRVTIQHKTTAYDEYNYETEAWTEFKKLWGKLDFLSVKDSINAKAAGSQTTARLLILVCAFYLMVRLSRSFRHLSQTMKTVAFI